MHFEKKLPLIPRQSQFERALCIPNYSVNPCMQLLQCNLPIIVLGANKDLPYEFHWLLELQSRSSHKCWNEEYESLSEGKRTVRKLGKKPSERSTKKHWCVTRNGLFYNIGPRFSLLCRPPLIFYFTSSRLDATVPPRLSTKNKKVTK